MATPLAMQAQTNYDLDRMQMERLDRGLVAVRQSADSVMLSWRYLREDPMDISFDIYRNNRLVATVPAAHSTTYVDANRGDEATEYKVVPRSGSKKANRLKGTYTLAANAPIGYLSIPLSKPADVSTPEGSYSYSANDATMADLDGDGQMEIILKWDPSNSRDNSQSGITGHQLVDAYKLDGRHLWRIDLGRNIRAGAHYTQIMAYDLDGNGKAEVVMKTADGTVDGRGRVIGDTKADYRVGLAEKTDNDYHSTYVKGELFRKDQKGRRGGFVAGGPEYLTVFEGTTGRAIHTIDYVPQQGDMRSWGDNYANRSERYLACIAYLDGVHPSVVMCRGYYARTALAAFDFDGKRLRQRWVFDTKQDNRPYMGQGNHNLRVGDVDGDGKDEIIYGACAFDHDGTGLYTTGMEHGDAMHMTGFMPLDDRLYVWNCHENKRDGSELHDAATGEIIMQVRSGDDVGRALAADIDATNPGLEMWSSRSGGILDYKGNVIDAQARIPINFALWWDGDLLREMLDHETISKWVPEEHRCQPLLQMEGCAFNNGSKSNPSLCCDVLGDWREEVVTRTADSHHLRIYVSTLPTAYRFHTFLQEPVYRLTVAAQNVSYNQPTCLGLYFGAELQGSKRLWRGWQF